MGHLKLLNPINMKGFKLHSYSNLIFLLVVLLRYSAKVSAQSDTTNNISVSQFQRREVLDPNIGLALEWSVNNQSNTITLQVEIQSGNENFALGLTKKGNIQGSDVIHFELAQENGTTTATVTDLYGQDNSTVIRDTNQDWRLVGSSTSQNLIRIQIRRSLDTCDEQDMKIDESLIQVSWDYGANSSLPSQFAVRGTKPVYFMDTRVYSNANVPDLRKARISRQIRLPPRHTSYWCSVHKMTPSLNSKHHIVGYSNYVKDKATEKHVHHQLIYRCSVPPGINPSLIFEKYVNHPGEECYLQDDAELPAVLCREMINVWAVGGPHFTFPDTIGIPIGETPSEYFMLETHYDNPEERSDLDIENGIEFEYTSQLRQNDGGQMWSGYGIPGLFAMPPESSNFNVVGHCSGQCTAQIFPLGVEIHAVALHAHTQARRMRFRHIRGNKELPWIQNDDNYDFNYQPVRILPEPVTILPGDQLMTQCSFDNTGRNYSASSSGMSTKDEMCTTFWVINKRVPRLLCSSEYPSETFMSRFGIESMKWDLQRYERMVTSSKNSSHVGLSMGEVVGNWSSWSPQERSEWERELMYGKHNGNCLDIKIAGTAGYLVAQLQQATGRRLPIPGLAVENSELVGTPLPAGPVSYPVTAIPYTPPNVCQNREPVSNGGPPGEGMGGTTIPNVATDSSEELVQEPPSSNANRPTFNGNLFSRRRPQYFRRFK